MPMLPAILNIEFPIGFKEVEGIHSRTDFDLKNHQEYSKKKMQYFDNDLIRNRQTIWQLYSLCNRNINWFRPNVFTGDESSICGRRSEHTRKTR